MVMVIFINKAFNVIYFTYILTILGFLFYFACDSRKQLQTFHSNNRETESFL